LGKDENWGPDVRLTCPYCGARDRREFTWCGDAVALARPARDAAPEAWDAYIHLRDNPAGATREIWYHDPCGAMILGERDTMTHATGAFVPAREVVR
jgi:heterotetrameric sarcosine oxidase delta subunit